MYIVRLIRGLAAALIGVAAAFGLAVPAQAQGNVKAPGVPEGVYNVNIDGQATTTGRSTRSAFRPSATCVNRCYCRWPAG